MSSKCKREVVGNWEVRGKSSGFVLRGVAVQARDREKIKNEGSEVKEAVLAPNGEQLCLLAIDGSRYQSPLGLVFTWPYERVDDHICYQV